MAEAKIALIVLTTGLVLDRSVFVGQTVSEMQETIASIRGAPKKSVTVIENGATFFTASNMLALIKANDDTYKLIAEKAKVTLRDEQVQAIQTAEAAQKAIQAIMVPPLPPYPFAPVPDGFDVTKVFETCSSGRSLRRIGINSSSLGLVQGELIWRYLSAAWAKNENFVSKYFRDNRVCEENGWIRVGCQRAYRHEIEQIAVWQSWKFPEPVAAKQ